MLHKRTATDPSLARLLFGHGVFARRRTDQNSTHQVHACMHAIEPASSIDRAHRVIMVEVLSSGDVDAVRRLLSNVKPNNKLPSTIQSDAHSPPAAKPKEEAAAVKKGILFLKSHHTIHKRAMIETMLLSPALTDTRSRSGGARW